MEIVAETSWSRSSIVVRSRNDGLASIWEAKSEGFGNGFDGLASLAYRNGEAGMVVSASACGLIAWMIGLTGDMAGEVCDGGVCICCGTCRYWLEYAFALDAGGSA